MKIEIIIINGPNLNLLGSREPNIYGDNSFENYYKSLQLKYPNILFTYFQSNHEGEIIDKLQQSDNNFNGIILNAAAYTHTSIAIGDTVAAIKTPVVEVHISNIFKREKFRQKSYIAPHCLGSISGFGLSSYTLAVESFVNLKHLK